MSYIVMFMFFIDRQIFILIAKQSTFGQQQSNLAVGSFVFAYCGGVASKGMRVRSNIQTRRDIDLITLPQGLNKKKSM